MKRLIAVVIILALGGAYIWHKRHEERISVRTHVLATGVVRATVANTRVGTVEACDRAQMSPAAPGQVAAINVREGDRVAANDILLEIWNEDRKAELRLKEAEASAAHSRATEACTTASGAEREADRLRKLRDRKLIAEESVDNAATEAESRRAACEASLAATRVSAAGISVARTALERTRLRAPFDGVVAEVDVRLGEYLTPSPPGIATIPAIDLIAPECVYVAAPIDEVDAPAIKAGMPVCVTLDAFPDKRCSAVVTRIAPYVLDLEKQARTVEVEVQFQDATEAEGLLPGYSADIEIMLETREDVLRVPTEAIFDDDQLLVVNPDTGVLEQRQVEIGVANWEYTEITRGANADEIVALSIGRAGVVAGAVVTAESDAD